MTTQNADTEWGGVALERLVRCAHWAWITAGALSLAGWATEWRGYVHGIGVGAFLMAAYFRWILLEPLRASNG